MSRRQTAGALSNLLTSFRLLDDPRRQPAAVFSLRFLNDLVGTVGSSEIVTHVITATWADERVPSARSQASARYSLSYCAGSSLVGFLGAVDFYRLGWSGAMAMVIGGIGGQPRGVRRAALGLRWVHARGFLVMTALPAGPPPRGEMVKLGLGVILRVSITIVLLFGAYFLVPTKTQDAESDLPWLILALGIFGVVVGIQVPAITKSKYPILRAIEALAVTVPLFLLIFSRVYLSNSLSNPGSFTQPLDHVTALYFAVTVFATVGFGDIVAATNGMKLLVTVQMILNLAVLGLVIRLLTSAAQRGVARRDNVHRREGDPGSDPGSA